MTVKGVVKMNSQVKFKNYPKVVAPKLLANINCLYQMGEIDNAKKNELARLVAKSFTEGYEGLNKELENLRHLVTFRRLIDDCLKLTT